MVYVQRDAAGRLLRVEYEPFEGMTENLAVESDELQAWLERYADQMEQVLGGVLGWAFTQPLIIVVVVFWAVGLGMALPYILFCLWPDLARILPKPGAWMHVFERIVGFMLMGTALYLLSVLPVERHMQELTV